MMTLILVVRENYISVVKTNSAAFHNVPTGETLYLCTGSFRISAHDIIASYVPWENFYALCVAALCSVFLAVFIQLVVRTREPD